VSGPHVILLLLQLVLLLVTAITVFSIGVVIWQLLKRAIAALRRPRG
jgi:hypothetical protein